jgi:hypothetical protein
MTMSAALTLAAAVGAKAFYALYIWLLSAIGASELSRRKGYGEKWGLGTGLIIWLIVPPKPDSPWRQRKARKAREEQQASTT